MFEFDALSVGYHYADYWTIWVGRVAIGRGSADDAGLLMFGLRSRPSNAHGIPRVVADILWASFFVRTFNRWYYYHRRNRQLAKAVRVESDCVCGHTIHSHTGEGVYFLAPCEMCECEVYVPAEHPYCECGHSGDGHVKLGPNVFRGCLDERCDCDLYTPEDIMAGISRLVKHLAEEAEEVPGVVTRCEICGDLATGWFRDVVNKKPVGRRYYVCRVHLEDLGDAE